MRSLLALAVVFAIALGMAGSEPVGAAPTPKPTAKPSPVSTPDPAVQKLSALTGKDFDVAYIREALPTFDEDIEITQAATLNADHPELLQWNQQMVERKSAQVAKMVAILKGYAAPEGRRGVAVVTKNIQRMRTLRGGPLEKAYLPMMAARFDRNVTLAALAAAKASSPDLKTLAGDIATRERREAALLREWLKKWYGI